MIFNSVVFGLFFVIVFLLYWIFFKKNLRARNIYLIAVSYIFYGWWDWRFLSLIIISSLVDYIIGKKLHAIDKPTTRKQLLFISLFVNLGFLGFFKYFNFFVDSMIDSFAMIEVTLNVNQLNIILPVGISFYTFQTLSYTLDIYYKRMKPTSDIYAFFAFVSFFPQLVAGPIERAKKLLPQFNDIKTFNYEALRSGLLLMAWGFFKKIVVADRLAIFVDAVYADVGNVYGLSAFLAILFFAFQLYLDFSAYSDIAIGCARTLGFNLSTNFRRPYLATSFSDFWKRWHISLSSWFKDYLYIPLGGNKVGKIKVYINVMIVFLISGLWHGASWNFVIWGAVNGLFIILFDKIFDSIKTSFFKRVLSSLIVTSFWALSLVLFRAHNFGDATTLLSNVLKSGSSIYDYGLLQSELNFALLSIVFVLFVDIFQEYKEDFFSWVYSLNFIFRWVLYLSVIAIVLLLGSYGMGLTEANFIYFQF